MPELVALDVVSDDDFPALLASVWDRGDGACVVDQRLAGQARDAQLAALSPTRRISRGPDGLREVRVPGGRGVETGDALVVTTSGLTTSPRAVVLTHRAVEASARATSGRLRVDPASDRWLCCLPCTHIGGLSVVTRSLLTRTPVDVQPRFDPDAALDAAARGATLVSLVATALARLGAPERFRTIVLGGAAPPSSRPANTVVTWGMTETGSGVVYDGVPLDGVEVAAREGELFIRGPMLARAYRDGAPLLAPGPDGTPGWFATGDGGEVVDGVVRVLGRIADVIVTGGEKVWPDEVEGVLFTHGRVADVAVWRRDDDEWGQRVVAFIVPTGEPPSLDELRAHVQAVLPVWCAPKELVIVESLPRSASGKVVRRRL